jgi:hypothetical protein
MSRQIIDDESLNKMDVTVALAVRRERDRVGLGPMDSVIRDERVTNLEGVRDALRELATVRALTPAQIDYLIEHHTNLAEDDEQTARAVAAGRLEVWDFGGSDALPETETAKAHRAMVAMLEALRGER